MTDTPLTSNQLAAERNDMAFGRTVMALERTLMAWIRTSLSLISFGFTIYKFLTALKPESGVVIHEQAARNLGLFLILLGLGTLTLAVVQFLNAQRRVGELSAIRPQFSLALIGAIGVILVGIFAILNVLFGIGGF